MPRILGLATTVPEYRAAQSAIKEAFRKVCGEDKKLLDMLDVFDQAEIAARHLVFPLDFYTSEKDFGERNTAFVEEALKLLEVSARGALERAGVAADTIDHVFFVTSTVFSGPTLEVRLAEKLGLRPDVRRSPLCGMGCVGGVAALARASDYLRTFPKHRALVLSVEVCSALFPARNAEPADLVSAALFGDGAAAAVVAGDKAGKAGAKILFTRSAILPGTTGLMGGRFTAGGLRLRLAEALPDAVARLVGPAVEKFLLEYALSLAKIRHWVLYPGGPRIIEAYETGLKLPPGTLESVRACLHEYGNLGSVSPFFVLEDADDRASGTEMGLMLAVGPGVALEMLILRW
ncbi:MAG: type III polyketide synthase [Planctomycetota bacterium]|jgi:alkylresorcinol/alkylpyrone synthase